MDKKEIEKFRNMTDEEKLLYVYGGKDAEEIELEKEMRKWWASLTPEEREIVFFWSY